MNDEFTPSLKAAQVKRFLECLQGDPAFRALLKPLNKTGAAAFLKSRGVDLDLDDLSVFFKDGFMEIPDKKNRSKNFVIKEWENAYRRERFRVDQLIDQMEDTLLPISFKNWRSRQIHWLKDKQGQEKPFSVAMGYELSFGCSMGCSFCAFSAKKLSKIFEYSPKNAKDWKEILTRSVSVLGGGAKLSCCYHATEPADNPDYFNFIQDVYQITGVVPQTTTAAPLRDLDWTLKLFEKRALFPQLYDRFSILSPQMLARVHQTFSVEQLARIPLVILGKGSLNRLANAGRARNTKPDDGDYNTIECTCGFIVNMCCGTIRLVMPCPADDAHPEGSVVLGQGKFSSPDEFETLLRLLCREHLTKGLPPILRFRQGYTYQQLSNGFELKGSTRKYGLTGKGIYKDAGKALAKGPLSSKEFMTHMVGWGHSPVNILAVLNTLFTKGFLSEISI